MINFTVSFNLDYGSNLHYSKTAILNEKLVNSKAIEEYYTLCDKRDNYIWF